MDMSNHERFHVVYDGPALEEHRMDVRDLAPALIAFADLFTAANKEINGDAAEVRVQVNASFKAGSFGIDLVAAQHLLDQIKDIFSGNGATAICNAWTLLGMVGLAGGGLIGMLRKLAGRRPIKIEQRGDLASVWLSQTESFEVERNVVRLYRNKSVRVSLEKVFSPLQQEGITEFGVVINNDVVLDVKDSEVGFFDSADAEEEVVSDTTSRKMLEIESLTFKDGNKWRVHDGTSTFYASIEDKEFLDKIDGGERFGKGDVLIVDLRQVQSVVGARLVTESTIIKVLDHRAPLQSDLL
ncbi:hypothetical protein QZM91_24170 [Burkholderia multivorans]|uniref:hypothetical protein n=1 Tax=Burkholderia multivorans TaxID=87883 RepID=UPI001FC82018|nr:hypothetical protein [Burkholderia multivorans]MCA8339832.1 hypothetical protein [Burkholderia multivorans]MCO1358851.1 hypothetical protein [Burkholderia multivorans]MCO1418679.1 hypothetical protein [Burkholderia multivorans]MDN7970650.1 hypothetical protein [Burkholderia multivorans]UQO98104.1 hypothetical protein L0Z41_20830 [Burkholderia multivorans]